MKFIQYAGVRLPTFGELCASPATEPLRREVEELKLAQHVGLKLVVLGRFVFFVGGNSATAINRASAVGAFHILHVLGIGALAVVVIEERDVGVVALDQAAARRVVVRRCQRKTGVLRQRKHGLD